MRIGWRARNGIGAAREKRREVPAEIPVSRAAVEIAVDCCLPSPDARPVDEAAVNALAGSIAEVGLLNPISVRRHPGYVEAFEVMAGMHRLAAFRNLGRETIPGFILETDDLRAALVLIDENLCRKDLSPAERAAQIAKRKRIYEALHPETAHGSPRVSRQVGDTRQRSETDRFTASTAGATGASERTIQREAARGEALGEVVLAKVARTSLDSGEELDALAKLSPDLRESIVERAAAGEAVSAKHAAKQERRADREAELGAKASALPEKRYAVILADPEWRFEPYSRATGLDRAPDNHYPTSTVEEIAARPVGDIAADHCVLFLWATAPMLPEALAVMAAWGFAYKSHLIWRKAEKHAAGLVVGTGYWFRNGHELLLLGTRGTVPAPLPGTQWPSMVDAPPRRHSEKPEIFLELIEAYFPTAPKIELNRRGPPRAGWDAWGNEVTDDHEPREDLVDA